MKYLLCLLFTNCATTPAFASLKLPEMTDAGTLDFIVDAVNYDGVASIAGKREYIINFKLPEKTVMFAIRTCNKERFFDTNKKDAIAYRHVPIDGIENTSELCNMYATAITSTGQKLWAYIDFVYPRENNPKYMLTAYTKCDGFVTKNVGGFTCQARADSTQEIVLDTPVFFAKAAAVKGSTAKCTQPEAKTAGTTYRIYPSAGACEYIFGDKNGATFRLITLAYKGVTP
ncbi:MAG: hypothetical protein RLY43_895 [Bacteroidota bacterium]|jgi:hypothetical protein